MTAETSDVFVRAPLARQAARLVATSWALLNQAPGGNI